MLSHTERESTRAGSEQGVSVPAMVYTYKAGLIGGALGGAAMVIVALTYGLLNGRLWLPVNLIGATVVRDLQTASLETLMAFNAAALIAGLALHALLSIGLGFIFALLLPTMPGPPMIWSLTVGPLLWALAGLLVVPAINPVMARSVDVPSFLIAHVAYSLLLGGWIARTPKIAAG